MAPRDELKSAILKFVQKADMPLETKEIIEAISKKYHSATRTKIVYRLNDLRGEGLIKGKFAGPGKGVWIWWRQDAFK